MQVPDEVFIELTDDQLDSRGGHGIPCAQITVSRPDGKIQRFWVKAILNNSGRVVCTVTACRPNLDVDAKQKVTGYWFKPGHPKESS